MNSRERRLRKSRKAFGWRPNKTVQNLGSVRYTLAVRNAKVDMPYCDRLRFGRAVGLSHPHHPVWTEVGFPAAGRSES